MTSNTDTTPEAVTYEKGTWQGKMNESSTILDRSIKARKRAGVLLWEGAVEGINNWLPTSDTDVSGEGFAAEVLTILGKSRKGDASKIKTVALAVKNNGLDLAVYPNLAKAYAQAVALTKTVQQQADEDNAAEAAIEALAANVPNSTTTVEGAALILLSKGIDGAVVAILDSLGASNFDAHRAFIRALSSEVADRVQAAKPKPVAKKAAAPKAGAKKATTTAATKAKPASAKAKPTPVSASKGDPNKKALPPKASGKAKPSQPVDEPVHAGDDVPSAEEHAAEVEASEVDAVTTPEVPVATKAKARPVPVRRR